MDSDTSSAGTLSPLDVVLSIRSLPAEHARRGARGDRTPDVDGMPGGICFRPIEVSWPKRAVSRLSRHAHDSSASDRRAAISDDAKPGLDRHLCGADLAVRLSCPGRFLAAPGLSLHSARIGGGG